MDASHRRSRLAHGQRVSSDSDRVGGGSDLEPDRDLGVNSHSTRNRITVALIEDNRLVREALTTCLNRCPDIQVIGEGPERHKSILLELNPDVVLLDLGPDDGAGLRLATQILDDFPRARVIVMDLLPACEELLDFVTAGVSGFIMKDASLEDVVGTIRAVDAGLKVLPDQITATLFAKAAEKTGSSGETQDWDSLHLTPREQEVADQIADGMSNKAIAKELHISIHTVKSHLRNIMDKLTVDSRLQVAKYVHGTVAQAEVPAPHRPSKGATPVSEPATDALVERTASRSGTDARGGHSRPGAERRTFGSSGRPRRRTRPRTHG